MQHLSLKRDGCDLDVVFGTRLYMSEGFSKTLFRCMPVARRTSADKRGTETCSLGVKETSVASSFFLSFWRTCSDSKKDQGHLLMFCQCLKNASFELFLHLVLDSLLEYVCRKMQLYADIECSQKSIMMSRGVCNNILFSHCSASMLISSYVMISSSMRSFCSSPLFRVRMEHCWISKG